MDSNVKVVETNTSAKTGQTKCPKCGATDISLNIKTGKLRCNFCRFEFEAEKAEGIDGDVSKLSGEIHGTGAEDIAEDAQNIVTLKCTSCGAEVVIDTASTTQARCHWCRNTLSINTKVANGAVPDVVLPFKISKQEAESRINEFVQKRRFFAHPQFKKEFTTENIMGVYLPYMIVDENAHVELEGQGEHEVRRYTVGSGDNKETRYDADLYNVSRKFDIAIDDLTVESSSDKLDTGKDKTNNIINSIMPFDTENSVKWDSNYLKGYTSEKRDTNISDLKDLVDAQCHDIARHKANSTLDFYDRGVKWDKEQMDVKGQQWKSAYLPVWLYSYQQKKGSSGLLHYVVVNARTTETMGSIPIHMPKLWFFTILVEILGIFLMMVTLPFAESHSDEDSGGWPYLFLFLGVVYYAVMYARYRNSGARHHHESETRAKMSNLEKGDTFVQHRTRLSNSRMNGANNNSINGTFFNAEKIMSKKLKNTAEKKIENFPKDVN